MYSESFFENELKNILLSNYEFFKKEPFFDIKCNFLPVKLRKILTNVENVNILFGVINIFQLHNLGKLFYIFSATSCHSASLAKIIYQKINSLLPPFQGMVLNPRHHGNI